MGSNMSLVLFTCLAQAAVGMVILFGLLPGEVEAAPGAAGGSAVVERLKARGGAALASALVLFGLGIIFSLLHLSDPRISFYSISNLGTSWLSREILAAGIFGGLVLLFFFVRKPFLNVAAALAGIALIYVISRVYSSTPVPFWSTAMTFWVFLSSGVMLGAGTLFLVAAFCGGGRSATMRSLSGGWLPLVLVAAAGGRLIFGVMQLINGIDAPVRFELAIINLVGISLALVFLFLAVRKQDEKMPFTALALAVAVLLWVAEVAGRIMFYEALTSFTM